MNGEKTFGSAKRMHVASVCFALLIALLPKCPLCWTAYASLLSTLGIASFPYYDCILPVMIAILLINLIALGIMARSRNRYTPFILSLTGAAIILVGKLWVSSMPSMLLGVFLIVAASLNNMLAKKFVCGKS